MNLANPGSAVDIFFILTLALSCCICLSRDHGRAEGIVGTTDNRPPLYRVFGSQVRFHQFYIIELRMLNV